VHTLRKARITDVEAIHRLVNYYASKGLMLARPRALLYESIREFTVAEESGQVVGVGGLHIIWEDLAEIRALAVAENMTGRGIGRKLVETLLNEARELHLPRVFTLTFQPGFFERCGFRLVPKEEMPQKVWRECMNCPHFPNCKEESLVIDLV